MNRGPAPPHLPTPPPLHPARYLVHRLHCLRPTPLHQCLDGSCRHGYTAGTRRPFVGRPPALDRGRRPWCWPVIHDHNLASKPHTFPLKETCYFRYTMEMTTSKRRR